VALLGGVTGDASHEGGGSAACLESPCQDLQNGKITEIVCPVNAVMGSRNLLRTLNCLQNRKGFRK